jgi:hypothetical protein
VAIAVAANPSPTGVVFAIAQAQSTALRRLRMACHLVIFFSGVVGSVVDLVVAVPLLSVVDVAWSGVGSVFAPGTPVAPPWVACSGVGLVFTPGTPVAPPCAPVDGFSSASAKVLDRAKGRRQCDCRKFHVFVSSLGLMRKPNRRKPLCSSNIKRCPMPEPLIIPAARIVGGRIGDPQSASIGYIDPCRSRG